LSSNYVDMTDLPLLPERYVAYGVTDAKPDFSKERRFRTILGGRLDRKQELEMLSGELQEMEAAGVPIDPVHDERISVGKALRGKADPKNGHFWVEFALYDNEAGRNKRDLIKANEIHDISLTTEEFDDPRRLRLARIALCSKGARRGTRICMQSPVGMYSTIQEACQDGTFSSIRQYIDPSVAQLECCCGCRLDSQLVRTVVAMATETDPTVTPTPSSEGGESKYDQKKNETVTSSPPVVVQEKKSVVVEQEKKTPTSDDTEMNDAAPDEWDFDNDIQLANACKMVSKSNLSEPEKRALVSIIRRGKDATVPKTIDVPAILKHSNLSSKLKKAIQDLTPSTTKAAVLLPPQEDVEMTGTDKTSELRRPPLEEVMKPIPDSERITADVTLRLLREGALKAQADPSSYDPVAERSTLDILAEKLRLAKIDKIGDREVNHANLQTLLHTDPVAFDEMMSTLLRDAAESMKEQEKKKNKTTEGCSTAGARNSASTHVAAVPKPDPDFMVTALKYANAAFGRRGGGSTTTTMASAAATEGRGRKRRTGDDDDEEDGFVQDEKQKAPSKVVCAAERLLPMESLRRGNQQSMMIRAAEAARERQQTPLMTGEELQERGIRQLIRQRAVRQITAGYANLKDANDKFRAFNSQIKHVDPFGRTVMDATSRLAVENHRSCQPLHLEPGSHVAMMEYMEHVNRGWEKLQQGADTSIIRAGGGSDRMGDAEFYGQFDLTESMRRGGY
jgi:hypothetical protein